MNKQNRDTLKQNHDKIISTLSTKQYFNWHSNYFNGDLDYKVQAMSIKKSTKSKKIQSLCDTAINFYSEVI